jgi:hypothetical protein
MLRDCDTLLCDLAAVCRQLLDALATQCSCLLLYCWCVQASFKLREEAGAVVIDNAAWREEGFMPLTAAVSDLLAHMNELKQHKVPSLI